MAAGFTVGIDLGGTKCLAVALDSEGKVRAERRVPTPTGEGAIVEVVAKVVIDVVAEAAGRATAVGVGAPGLVDNAGVLRFAPNLPGVADLPLGPELAARLSVPVRVENDATAAAWGERVRGAGAGSDDVVLVTVGTGIGGGIVAGGRLYLGANGFAGEIGHMVVDPDGPPCPCGKRGCWERFASGSGLGWLAREAAGRGEAAGLVEAAGGDIARVRGEHVTRLAAAGDPEARRVLSLYAWWLALGLANLANILDPEVIVLGGGVLEAGDALMGPTVEAFSTLVVAPEHRPAVRVVPAQLGERAGAIGAALLATERAPL